MNSPGPWLWRHRKPGNRVEAFEFRYGGNRDVGPFAKIFAGPAFFETTFFRIGRHYLQNVVNALRIIFVIHTMVSVICKNSNKNQYGSNYFTKSSRHKYVVTICEVFSRIDFFSKKECTGCTRLMRQEYRPKRRAEYFNDLICEINNCELYL